MRKQLLLVLLITGISAGLVRVQSAQSVDTRERVPVIVELFTSEGCSSCPPADEVLSRLVATQPVPNAEIIALGEHVDYWDRLGWRDPFSSALFTARQSEYDAKAFRTGNIYTPQLIVNGHEQLIGGDYRAAVSAIERASTPRLRVLVTAEHIPAKTSVQATTRIETPERSGSIGAADVVVAIVEDGLVSQVKRGENKGRELRHSAVVRSLKTLGSFASDQHDAAGSRDAHPWSADTTIQFSAEWNASRSRCIVFVQERATRKILGAASARLARASGGQ